MVKVQGSNKKSSHNEFSNRKSDAMTHITEHAVIVLPNVKRWVNTRFL